MFKQESLPTKLPLHFQQEDGFLYLRESAWTALISPHILSIYALLYLLVIYCGQVTWLCLALLVSAASHAVLAWSRVSPYLAIVAMGLAYSVLASALWSLPAILLPPHMLATAFGIMQVNTQFGFGRKIFELIDLLDIIIDTKNKQ